MRAMIVFIFLPTILVTSPGFTQPATFTKPELVADLEMLWEAIREHPKAFEFTSEVDFAALRQSVKSQLREGMTADGFLRIAHPLPVSIGCNHSIL